MCPSKLMSIRLSCVHIHPLKIGINICLTKLSVRTAFWIIFQGHFLVKVYVFRTNSDISFDSQGFMDL